MKDQTLDTKKKISVLRSKINALDQEISKLLVARLKISESIGSLKKKQGMLLHDKNREKSIITSITNQATSIQQKKYLSDIYSRVLLSSRQYQTKK